MKKSEEILTAYAAEQEAGQPQAAQDAAAREDMASKMGGREPATETARAAREGRYHGRTDLPDEGTGLEYKDNLGWLKIPVETLPTTGMFYPEGTEVRIRAARGAEIKHWSTMNDRDTEQLAQTDDILNYIVERCVAVKMPGIPGSSWKDIKVVDRFYLLLAVREYTFIDGENELKVPVSDGKTIPLVKEMVDFIRVPDDLARYYSPDERCFVFKLKTGREFRMYIPSIGANDWLKNYVLAKSRAGEQFDQDFVLYAPMLIKDFRSLSQRAYEEMVNESSTWSVNEWSLVSHVRDELADASEPKIKYQDEGGAEVEMPFTFQGGIKALFTIQDTLSILC